jgi:hypothetical protein
VDRIKRLIARLLLLAVSCVISVVLLDLAFRRYEDARLIRELPAGAQSYMLELLHYNDHEGLLQEQRSPGEYRILSFGDSFAQSITIPRLSYAARLQERLSEASGRPVRVVNFGRHGTSFPDYLSQLWAWTERVEYDAVMLNIYAGNDFIEQSAMLFVETGPIAHRPRDTAGLRYGPGLRIPERHRLRFLDYLEAHYYSRLYDADASERDERYHERAVHYPHEVYMRAQDAGVGVYRPELVEAYADAHFWLYKLLLAARELERSGKRVALTLAPPHFAADPPFTDEVLAGQGLARSDIDLDLPGRLLAEMATAVGFEGPVLSLSACLRDASARGEVLYWGTNTHWSVDGNERVAQILAPELATRWLGVGDAPRVPELGDCATRPALPGAALRDYVSTAISSFDALLEFEQTTLAELGDRVFADEAALFGALEASGHVHEPARIDGAVWGFVPVKRVRFTRPHGIMRIALVKGWAQDGGAPAESVMVAFFRGGRLLGVGRTSDPPGELAAFIGDEAAARHDVLFEGLIAKPTPKLASVDELWVVAITKSGSFARLPWAPGPPRLIVPGGAARGAPVRSGS